MPERGAVFLARRAYRRRRLVDASRALPVLGAFLFSLPALGLDGGSRGLIVLLAAWAALIALAAALAPRLAEPQADDEREAPRPPPAIR